MVGRERRLREQAAQMEAMVEGCPNLCGFLKNSCGPSDSGVRGKYLGDSADDKASSKARMKVTNQTIRHL